MHYETNTRNPCSTDNHRYSLISESSVSKRAWRRHSAKQSNTVVEKWVCFILCFSLLYRVHLYTSHNLLRLNDTDNASLRVYDTHSQTVLITFRVSSLRQCVYPLCTPRRLYYTPLRRHCTRPTQIMASISKHQWQAPVCRECAS